MQTVLLMVVLIGFAALGIEITNLLLQQRRMQAAADAAAIAGGLTGRTLTQARIDAYAIAGSHGFANGVNNVTVTVNKPPSVGSYGSTATEVIIRKSFPPLLLALFVNQAITVQVRAISNPISVSSGCLLALEPTAGDAVTIINNSSINNTLCELVSNSTSSRALVLQNSSFIIGPVYLLGNYVLGNGASITGAPLTINAANAVEDPYAAVVLPTAPACPDRASAISGNNVTLQPGRYCDGMIIANNSKVTLSPGIYYIDKFFTMNQNSIVSGTGVTLLFNTATTTTIGQGVSLTLTAPLTGSTAGMAITSQRNVTGSFAFENNSKIVVEGAMYLPNMTVTINNADTGSLDKKGNFDPTLGSPCTQLIANKLVLGSKIGFRADCSGTAVKPIGRAQPVLVE